MFQVSHYLKYLLHKKSCSVMLSVKANIIHWFSLTGLSINIDKTFCSFEFQWSVIWPLVNFTCILRNSRLLLCINIHVICQAVGYLSLCICDWGGINKQTILSKLGISAEILSSKSAIKTPLTHTNKIQRAFYRAEIEALTGDNTE